ASGRGASLGVVPPARGGHQCTRQRRSRLLCGRVCGREQRNVVERRPRVRAVPPAAVESSDGSVIYGEAARADDKAPSSDWPGLLLSSYSSLYVPVNGDGDVMDKPGVPLLVRLQVSG